MSRVLDLKTRTLFRPIKFSVEKRLQLTSVGQFELKQDIRRRLSSLYSRESFYGKSYEGTSLCIYKVFVLFCFINNYKLLINTFEKIGYVFLE